MAIYGRSAVSYTHLDVYKRQLYVIGLVAVGVMIVLLESVVHLL